MQRKKRFEAEKNLSKNLEDKDRIEREFLKKKEQVKKFTQRISNLFDERIKFYSAYRTMFST